MKSSKTVLLHLGHLGSSSDSMTYIRHLGHPTNTIELNSGLLIDKSDDTHELRGETEADRLGDSIVGFAPLGLALGGDKFNFKSNFCMLLSPFLLLMISSLIMGSSKLLFCLFY